MYALPGLGFKVLDMFMPCTISRQIYAKVFMRICLINLLVVHKDRWMVWFIYFSGKINNSNLEEFKVTSHIEAHISILERSAFNLVSESRGSTTM